VLESIEVVAHKARLAAAVQTNLELRAKLLRAMLRAPGM